MSEPKIPGPFEFFAALGGSENHRGYRIVNADGWTVAEVRPGDADGKYGFSCATLFVAAPDLFKACAEFVRKVECGEARSTRSYKQMKAAVARALGDEPEESQ